jgi:hypothetical protein
MCVGSTLRMVISAMPGTRHRPDNEDRRRGANKRNWDRVCLHGPDDTIRVEEATAPVADPTRSSGEAPHAPDGRFLYGLFRVTEHSTGTKSRLDGVDRLRHLYAGVFDL